MVLAAQIHQMNLAITAGWFSAVFARQEKLERLDRYLIQNNGEKAKLDAELVEAAREYMRGLRNG